MTASFNCVILCLTLLNMGGEMEEHAWRSIRFPKPLSETIEDVAKKERRTFSAQALIYIEKGLEAEEERNKESA